MDEKTRKELEKKIAESQSKFPRYAADTQRILEIERIHSNNTLVGEILAHHSTYPFQKLSLTCKESIEARDFYLEILKSIKFSSMLPNMVGELLKIGEAFISFEGSWVPPNFLDPSCVTISVIQNQYGKLEEHIEFKIDQEIREMVLNTPHNERPNLLKLLDAYSIRQIELGRNIDLSRSPNVKVLHPKRLTSSNPNAPRGVPFFDPIMEKLIDAEFTKHEIANGKNANYKTAAKKLKETDQLTFGFSFDLTTLENEFKYLQEIVKYTMIEEVFKPAAMAKNFSNEKGLILPTLHLQEIDLKSSEQFSEKINTMKAKFKIDEDNLDEYINQLKKK